MNQKTDYLDPAKIMISVEEFDSLEGVHEFSAKYKERKEQMLRKYRKSVRRKMDGRRAGQCAAAAALLVLATGTIGVAANSEFFYRVWGTHGKEKIESHEEVLYDEEKGTSTTVTYPQREYTDKNMDRAEELIGSSLSYGPVVREIGDTRLTILASVCDGNAAVVEFTLEREGGVTALRYSQLDNESKGAWFAEDAPFYFQFADCHENIFVDLERSTEDTLYCYDYMVVQQPDAQTAKSLTMEIYERETGQEEWGEAESLQVPISSEAQQREYGSAEGGKITISPLSMKIDMGMVPGLTKEEAGDPWHAFYVSVNYKDGTNYLVHEHEIPGIHSCEVETDNASYALEDMENQLIFVFNRLNDPEQVESITVNETVYTAK